MSTDPRIFQIKDYDVIECDYKYCAYRSEELHEEKTQEKCWKMFGHIWAMFMENMFK